MKKSQIAAQLYTLRDYLKTPGGVDRGLARLREIGYQAVQVSGVAAAPEVVKKYADANGMAICATHESGDLLTNHLDDVIAKLKLFNCAETAFPCPFEYQIIDEPTTIELARTLDEIAVKLARENIQLSYHNHNLEFRKVNGKRVLDVIYDNAPHLNAEIDTYWVQMGGCNPLEYVRKYAGRQTIFHLKDFGVIYPRTAIMVPVGSGNLDWDEIVPAADKAGVKWFIVEQDQCQKDPFESLQDSFNFLTKFCQD